MNVEQLTKEEELKGRFKARKKKNTISGVLDLYWAFLVAQMIKNLPVIQETCVWSLGWEDPLEKGMAIHSSILAGEFHGQRSLVGYSP